MSELLLTVYVAGQKLSFIDDIRIERSLENFAYSFSCSCVPSDTDFKAGDKTEVFWNEAELGERKDAVFSGYIDQINLELSGQRYHVNFSARSYALDLIDSVDSLESIEGDLSYVVEKVCKEYSIPFTNTAGKNLGWVRFACENESPFRILNDLARARGAMLVTNGWGALELSKVKNDTLNSGQVLMLSNITELKYNHDLSQCYHKYSGVILGTEYSETDSRIRKSRVLQIGSDSDSIGLMRSRLKNEKNRRYGMSQRLEFSVAGWKAPDFKTHWYENSNVSVTIPELGIKDRQFFLYAVTLIFSKYSGYQSRLHCCNREAFDLKASSESTRGKPQKSETVVVMSGIKKQREKGREKLDGRGEVRGL